MVALGDWDTSNFSSIRWVTFTCYTVVLTVIMMNLLIAVLSDTFANFQVNSEVYNLREVLELVIEYNSIFRYFTP